MKKSHSIPLRIVHQIFGPFSGIWPNIVPVFKYFSPTREPVFGIFQLKILPCDPCLGIVLKTIDLLERHITVYQIYASTPPGGWPIKTK